MRTRQKLTVLGACALSTGAVLAGVSVTSHAMADTPPPVKGTVTVIAQTSGSDGPIKCVYDDIDLPAPGSLAGSGVGRVTTAAGVLQSGGPEETSAGGFSTSDDSGPVDASAGPGAGAVLVSSAVASSADAVGTDTAPAFVVNGTAGAGTPLPVPDGLLVVNGDDVTAGTAEQCAALKPTSTGLPPLPTTGS